MRTAVRAVAAGVANTRKHSPAGRINKFLFLSVACFRQVEGVLGTIAEQAFVRFQYYAHSVAPMVKTVMYYGFIPVTLGLGY